MRACSWTLAPAASERTSAGSVSGAASQVWTMRPPAMASAMAGCAGNAPMPAAAPGRCRRNRRDPKPPAWRRGRAVRVAWRATARPGHSSCGPGCVDPARPRLSQATIRPRRSRKEEQRSGDGGADHLDDHGPRSRIDVGLGCRQKGQRQGQSAGDEQDMNASWVLRYGNGRGAGTGCQHFRRHALQLVGIAERREIAALGQDVEASPEVVVEHAAEHVDRGRYPAA